VTAVRWRYADGSYGSDAGAAENPPEGVIVSYWLAEKPDGEVRLEVLDREGAVVRRLSSIARPPSTPEGHPDRDPKAEDEPELTSEPGLNRAAWDLRYDRAKWVVGTRIDTGGPPPGPLALPGDYTVRLVVDGETFSQPLRVEADPRSTASQEELAAQLAFNLRLRAQLNRIVQVVSAARDLRGQLENLRERVPESGSTAELRALAEDCMNRLGKLEEVVHNPQAEVNYDILAGRHGGAKLYSRLAWLALGADGHDGPPTQGMLEVAAALAEELGEVELELKQLAEGAVAQINEQARELELDAIVIPENARDAPGSES
jgi:hypothetical protein